MNKLVCCTSIASVGCTFMDWSIYFLSGHDKFFRIEQDSWIDLSRNPVQTINAHGHRKNHPDGLEESKKTIDILRQKDGLVSYYPTPIKFDHAAKKIGINTQSPTQGEWQQINKYREDDYNQLLKFSASQQAKIIFISINDSLPIYFHEIRSMNRFLFTPAVPNSLEDIRNERDNLFFKESVDTWSKLGLTNTWDIRERLALSEPLKNAHPYTIDFSFEHYWIDCQSWFYDGKQEIKNIMTWLELSIDSDRFDQWTSIYEAWQQIQLKTLRFQYNYQHIVDCVVNNWSYPIDLTFEQEVVIQHCLIYDHGLNLKTWQLEKFPNNTKDLHQLLEPNIHPLK